MSFQSFSYTFYQYNYQHKTLPLKPSDFYRYKSTSTDNISFNVTFLKGFAGRSPLVPIEVTYSLQLMLRFIAAIALVYF